MASLADLQQKLEAVVDGILDLDLQTDAATWWRVGQWPTGRWVIYDEKHDAAAIVVDLGGTKGEALEALRLLIQWQLQLARRVAGYTMVASQEEPSP